MIIRVEIECVKCKHPITLHPEKKTENCFFCGELVPKVLSVTFNQMRIDTQGEVN